MDEIINKVAGSGIVSINLEDYYEEGERVLFDIKPFLYQDLVLKEKAFREAMRDHNWEQYRSKLVGIVCSSDAIVPTWAYMLVALQLESIAKKVIFGDLNDLEILLFREKLNSIEPSLYKDARVVIKGCADKPVPVNAFVEMSLRLKPYAKSIMFGEPCSTVPLFKAKAV
ncbi:MAG TPA: DUF2480 family protein [Bacteroidia bacterium]|nr:DUF2480 family protein [Bacteroidia bacterium]